MKAAHPLLAISDADKIHSKSSVRRFLEPQKNLTSARWEPFVAVAKRLILFAVASLAAMPVFAGVGISITCPTNITVQCYSDVPAPANDETSFEAQGGTIT